MLTWDIKVTYVRGILIIIAQILGAIAASGVIYGIQPGGFNVGTSLGGPTTVAQGLFIEMFLTIQLVFTIFMLAAEKHRGTFMAPLGIGLSLFIAELMLVTLSTPFYAQCIISYITVFSTYTPITPDANIRTIT